MRGWPDVERLRLHSVLQGPWASHVLDVHPARWSATPALRNLRWLALLGIVLAASRAFIVESTTAFDPEAALTEVVTHTHYLPRHWRGR